MKRDNSQAKLAFIHHVSPTLLLDDFASKIARELWWMNQEFYPVNIIHCGPPHSYITWGMNNRSVSGRGSETESHTINITPNLHDLCDFKEAWQS
jgi:hypothetical protein